MKSGHTCLKIAALFEGSCTPLVKKDPDASFLFERLVTMYYLGDAIKEAASVDVNFLEILPRQVIDGTGV